MTLGTKKFDRPENNTFKKSGSKIKTSKYIFEKFTSLIDLKKYFSKYQKIRQASI